MLENEPNTDTTETTDNTTEATDAGAPEQAAEAATAPVRTRRRAASRKAGPPKKVETTSEAVTTTAAAQSVEDQPEPVVQTRSRRRATRTTAAPEALPEPEQPDLPEVETDDSLGQALQALEARKGLAQSVAAPFLAPPDPAEILAARDVDKGAEDEDADDEGAEDEDAKDEDADAAPADEDADAATTQATDTDRDPNSTGGAESGHGADSDDSGSDDRGSEDRDSEDRDTDDDSDDSNDDDQSSGSSRRRRRRRGGRRRRRGSNGDDSGTSDGDSGDETAKGGQESQDKDETTKESNGPDADSGSNDSDDDADDESSSSGRRRRRRRRRGGGGGSSESSDRTDEVTGIEGSTRMEAKRQRRREGRASRRRTPILSEAEFLARRESVDRQMIIRQNDELSQIAVLEDNVLVEHYVDRASASSLIGNVYLGRVQNVLPSMEAAFIDIGRGRNAVLYAGDIDWDAHGVDSNNRQVENALKSGQTVLVQVTKDPVGAKGARLTNHISLPGRYIVYAPGGHLSGISRKLPDTERKRLRDVLGDLVGDDASVIVRTAAEGASEEELVRDVNRLKAQWEAIEKQAAKGGAPTQLYVEPDPTVRIVRDLFTEDFSKLIIQGNGSAEDAYDTVTAYVQHVAPHLSERIERWTDTDTDAFAAHRIDEQIAKALERKVFLPSGGSLVIDRTEAMTVIDVNTGKFTGSGGNLEATVTANNLEAAEEVVRQLRLRDIGGIIVVDFIDMVLPANRELLLRRLVECLGRDRTRHQVAEVTSLGLVQMTRKKIGTGLAEAFTEECEHCSGRGFEIHDMPVDSQEAADGGERRRRRGNGRKRGGSGKN